VLTSGLLLVLGIWWAGARWATPTSPPPNPASAFLTALPTHTLSINDNDFSISLADNEATRTQGLSGTTYLAPQNGMLFVFDEVGYHGIWMKDMNYALDILWLDEQRAIVHMDENVMPESYATRQIFRPQQPARFVLELPAGSVAQFDLAVGQVATIPATVLPADLQTP